MILAKLVTTTEDMRSAIIFVAVASLVLVGVAIWLLSGLRKRQQSRNVKATGATWVARCRAVAAARRHEVSEEHAEILRWEGDVLSTSALAGQWVAKGLHDFLVIKSLHAAFFKVGLHRSSRGDHEGSEKSLRIADDYIRWPSSTFALAMTLVSSGRPAEAVQAFERCISDMPQREELLCSDWPALGCMTPLLDLDMKVLGFSSAESLVLAAQTALKNYAEFGIPTPWSLREPPPPASEGSRV